MSANLDPGRGGGGGSGGSDDDGGDNGGGDDGGGGSGSSIVTTGSVLAALGIGVSTWDSITAFGDRLADAESFSELVVNVILTEFVGWLLTLAELAFEQVIESLEVLGQSLWNSLVNPISTGFALGWGSVVGALEDIQLLTESVLAQTGLAAPFVALGGWVAVLLAAAILVGVVWAIAETYLPVEAIVENGERLVNAGLAPVRIAAETATGAAASARELIGGRE